MEENGIEFIKDKIGIPEKSRPYCVAFYFVGKKN